MASVDLLADPAALLLALDRQEYEESLYLFLRAAWRQIDPSQWVDGWPIEAIAEHLEAIVDGEIKRLLINIPPRCSKSSLCSVAFPAWTWAQSNQGPTSGPGVPFLHASYAHQLSLRDSVKCRRLIESPWYQSLWGSRFDLTGDQNTKSRFGNTRGGERLITSIGAGVTGEGGNIIVIDDPNAANEAFSEATIQATIDWWDTTMSTRLNDPKTGAYIVIQQRLAEDDLTGHIMSKDVGEWTWLCMPMHYDPDRSLPTKIGWTDPRTIPGELLWSDRFDEPSVKALERSLGPFASAGQLEQSPQPKGGGVIKREWWVNWTEAAFPPMDYIVAYLDTAYTEKTENDYSALTVWGVFTTDPKAAQGRYIDADGRVQYIDRVYTEQAPKVMLMYGWHDRVPFHELVKKTAELCGTDKKKGGMSVDLLMVENKAVGISLAQEMRRLYADEPFGVQLDDPKNLDKLARLYSVQHLFAEGMIYAPDRTWADAVITEVASFPKGKNDDFCFVAGTMIETENGSRPIETLSVGDSVLTPNGYRRVSAAGMTGWRSIVQHGPLIGTGNHPVFDLDEGWRPLDTVSQQTRFAEPTLCGLIQTLRRSEFSSTASTTASWADGGDTTSLNHGTMLAGKEPRGSTWRYGSMLMAPFHQATKSIISTAIPLIAALKTWSAYRGVSIAAYLRKTWTERSRRDIWRKFDLLLQYGIALTTDASGTSETPSAVWSLRGLLGMRHRPKLASAYGVALGSNIATDEKSHVHPHARRPFLGTGKGEGNQSPLTTCPVYNLTVEGEHCYYANGVLVHNCDTTSGALRYLRNAGLLTRSPEKMAEIERSKQYQKPEGPLYPGMAA